MVERAIAAEVERLKAQVEALLKAREAISERIVALSERLGELRSSLVEHERSSATLEAETKKAIELIRQVKPEEILKEVRKVDAKIEALRARIESYEALIDRVVEEMKDLRRTFVKFKSLDTVSKLAEDFEKDLKEAKKVEASMRSSAAKVESILREVERRYKRFIEIERVVKELGERFRSLLKEFDKLRIEFSGVARKEDFEKVEKRVESWLKESEELNRELKKRREELREIITSTKGLAEVNERVAALVEERKIVEKRLGVLDELVESFSKLRLAQEKMDNRLLMVEEFVRRAVTKAEISALKSKLEKRILDFDRLIREYKRRIELWERKLRDILKASKVLIQTTERIERYERALKNFEKRQKYLVELLEAAL